MQDRLTGKQDSLGTKDRGEARTLLHARNESVRQPMLNFQIARAYLVGSDPEVATRTWQAPMDQLVKLNPNCGSGAKMLATEPTIVSNVIGVL